MGDKEEWSVMRNLIACALAVLVGGLAWGEESVAVAAKPKAAIARPRYIPEEGPKHKWWLERHEAKLAEAKALGKEIDLVFIGDSITHGWEGHGKDVLAELRQTYSTRSRTAGKGTAKMFSPNCARRIRFCRSATTATARRTRSGVCRTANSTAIARSS